MHRSESLRKLMKIFILAFLCSEMHSNFTPSDAAEHPFDNYPKSINGSETIMEQARHQASIRLAIDDYIFGEGHMCGGAVIAPSVVLTVAQCLYNYQSQTTRHPAELKIVMGTLNRYQRNENTLVYGVTHVHQPRTFNALTLRDNIAVIMLERDIPYAHPTVKPITLNLKTFRGNNGNNNDKGNGNVMLNEAMGQHAYEVTSWLTTNEHIPYTQLMSLNATHINDQPCLEKYGPIYGPDMICMGYQGFDQAELSQQDMGAPLIHNDVLFGLTSTYNIDFKSTKSNAASFVDVAYHAQWILEQIGDGKNCNSSVWGSLAFLVFTVWTARRTKWFKLWI